MNPVIWEVGDKLRLAVSHKLAVESAQASFQATTKYPFGGFSAHDFRDGAAGSVFGQQRRHGTGRLRRSPASGSILAASQGQQAGPRWPKGLGPTRPLTLT
jgi:hypothetical protein